MMRSVFQLSISVVAVWVLIAIPAQAQRGRSGRDHSNGHDNSHGNSHGNSHDHHGHHGHHGDSHGNSHGHHGNSQGHHQHSHGHSIGGHGHHTGSIGVYGVYSLPYRYGWGSSYPSYSGYPYSYYSPYYSSYSSPLYSGSQYLGSQYSGSQYSGLPYSSSVYSSSIYSSPLYSSPLYSNPLYSSPSALTAPMAVPSASGLDAGTPPAASGAGNAIPAPRQSPALQGGTFVLSNPRDSGGPIRYTLNSYTYTINPGEMQTVQLDRDWVITFDNGLNQAVSYRMEEGVYEFTVSPQSGWDLVKRSRQAPAAAGADGVPGRRSL